MDRELRLATAVSKAKTLKVSDYKEKYFLNCQECPSETADGEKVWNYREVFSRVTC